MDLNHLDKIRKLAIISLFSDDDLMELFALKGGNALTYIYNIHDRASMDIDVSLESSFDELKLALDQVSVSLETSLQSTFTEEGYHVFDVNLDQRPSKTDEKENEFWGGYRLEFKIIELEKWHRLKSDNQDIQDLRKQAISLDNKHHKSFKVDISKHEYCKGKVAKELDYYTIYVYTPIMIVIEKLRSICQQMEDYKNIVPSHRLRPRGQDFFDIYNLVQNYTLNLYEDDSLNMLKEMFSIKKVPLEFLLHIESEREFHRDSFDAVKDTVRPEIEIKEYDFYFNHTLEIVDKLVKILRIK